MDRWPALFSERQLCAKFKRVVATDLVQSFLGGLDALVHVKTLDVLMKGMLVGLLIGHEDVMHEAFPRQLFNVTVVVEETIILHNLQDVPTVLAILMATIYCLNLEYPREMKYFFEFLQKVIMKIQPDQC
ncbi:uncharacterized protein LOC111845645 isoform X2 [Xyrichtys novacula]|uniref:Uncharacterized protein LOC111845645 isoform X2 n=1 Tax=Xyrichtys novacula TaxID=13765 RepID=A0AAV1HMX8_XYRNO|nr:uncharacterized protein LOC111845645 isoform X2 [Xyrichtys novacula]